MGIGIGAILAQQFRANSRASSKLEVEQLRHLVSHLRSIASGMAAGVDMHQGRIEMVNHSLSQIDGDNPAMLDRAINALLQANKMMQQELQDAQSRIVKQAQALEQVTAQARTDVLTGVANRLAFNEIVEDVAECFKTEGRTTTLALLDIDFFKKINDTYGHAVGDQVLAAIGGLLQTKLQGRGIVARYGGEEFGILFAGCPVPWMVRLMEETRTSIGQTVITTDQGNIRVTCSVGMADFQADDTAALLFERVDDGLYLAKQNGRDRGFWFQHGKWLPMETQSLEMIWHPLETSGLIVGDLVPETKKAENSAFAARVGTDAAEAHDQEADVVATTEECAQILQQATKSAANSSDNTAVSAESPKAASRSDYSTRPKSLQSVIDHEKFSECLSQALHSIPDSGEPVSVLSIRIANRQALLRKYGEDALNMCQETLLQAIRCSLRGVDKIGLTDDGDFEIVMVGPVLEAVCYRAARISIGLNSANDTLALTEMKINMATTIVHSVVDTTIVFSRIREALAFKTDPAIPCIVIHDGAEIRLESHPLMGL